MNQTLPHMAETLNLENISLVAWRIRKTRARLHEKEVHRQIMDQLHEDNPVH